MKEEDSSDQERLGALYSLSQLSYIAEDYKQAINYLLEWMDLEENLCIPPNACCFLTLYCPYSD